MFKNLLSRKFIVTISALAIVVTTGDVSSFRTWIIGGVAALYVIAETILDARGMPQILPDVASAVVEGIAQGKQLTSDVTPVPRTLPSEDVVEVLPSSKDPS